MDPATPGTATLAWMAMDAYDFRDSPGEIASTVPQEPEIGARFPGWERLGPETGYAELKNATIAFGNGLDIAVYRNDATQQIVVGFRGTELSQFLETAEDGEFGKLTDLAYDRDVATLFGYWTDGGVTIEREVDGQGGLRPYIRDTFGVSDSEARAAVLALNAIDGDPLGGGVEPIARKGESTLVSQARQAVASTIEIAAENPGYTVSVTGHSLGGALAAYVAGAVGVHALALDPAPWGNQAILETVRGLADELLAGDYSGLDTAAAGWETTGGPVATAGLRVETVRLEGSFVPDIYLSADPRQFAGVEAAETVIELADEGVTPLERHGVELHTLLVDSAARAAPGRPSLEALAADAPGLLGEMFDGAQVSPVDDLPETFVRALVISDPFYRLFADTMTRIEAETDAVVRVPDGAEAVALETVLIDTALVGLGEIVAAAETDMGGTPADLLGDPAGSDGEDYIVGAFGEAETFRPGEGADFVATGGGIGAGDTVIGPAAALDGDRLWDFSREDRLVFEGASFGPDALGLADGGRTVTVDADGDGAVDAAVDFGEPIALGQVRLRAAADGGTELTLLPEDGPITPAGARTVALLYEAALDRQGDATGLNFWIDAREDGLSVDGLSRAFLASDEFAATVGEPDTLSDMALVEGLYRNVLDRDGDAAGVAFWTGELSRPDFDAADALIAFARSAENRDASPEVETLEEVSPGFWDVQPVA